MSESKTTVAVVDDDASFSKAICRLLRAAGFYPISYSSAESYLAAQASFRPACLVLDIHLGGISGLELQQRLHDLGDATPIIFVTAHDESDAREQALKAGCANYFRKPVHRDQLLEAIRKALLENTSH
jgi:FixJ family two-component response regulator